MGQIVSGTEVSGTEGTGGKQGPGPLELVFPRGDRLRQSLVRAGCGSHSFILTSPSGGLQGRGFLAVKVDDKDSGMTSGGTIGAGHEDKEAVGQNPPVSPRTLSFFTFYL